jgi:hypothetical protein
VPQGVRSVPEPRTCAFCGSTFEVRLAREKREQRFCSIPCSARHLGRTYQDRPRASRNVSDTERLCRTCAQIKPLTEFYSGPRQDRASRGTTRLYFSDCKACCSELRRLARYGTTLGEMVERQGSATCPLCLTRQADSLDHDHSTGEPRGALCRKCNLIMHYMDDREWRARAEAYIARKI